MCEAWTIDANQPLSPCSMWSWQYTNDTHDGVPSHSCLLSQGGGPVTKNVSNFMSGCQFGTVCTNDIPGVRPNATNLIPAQSLRNIQRLRTDAAAAAAEKATSERAAVEAERDEVVRMADGAAKDAARARLAEHDRAAAEKADEARRLAEYAKTKPPARVRDPLPSNCKAKMRKMHSFASNYTAFLVSLHDVFNGKPDSLMDTVGAMNTLKQMAVDLMNTNDPRVPCNLGIGPPWEYVNASSQYHLRGGRARVTDLHANPSPCE